MASESWRSIFVLGGARSGKSALARRLAAALLPPDGQVLFVATAWASDAEMARRIERHRRERLASWGLLELAPGAPLRGIAAAAPGFAVILLDCLSLWVAGWVSEREALVEQEEIRWEEWARKEVEGFFAECQERLHLVVVSLEVGSGLVPSSPQGRRYRDLLGLVNQTAARAAQEVYLTVAGVPLSLKGGGVPAP